jgi:hypothetical protein
MRRIIITEGDGDPVLRRATRHSATAEVYLPPVNPAQSTSDGPGVRLAVGPDGTWQVAAIAARRSTAERDRARDRETVVASGDLTRQSVTAGALTTDAATMPDLTDTYAQSIVRALAHRFGWAYVLYDRAEFDDRIGDELTDQQWQRLRHTPACNELSHRIRSLVHGTGLLTDVIDRARIRCEFCATLLDPPPPPDEPARCPICQSDPDTPEGASHA